MSAPNIGQFETPTGQKGNIFSPKSWLSGILGAAVLFFFLAIGQNIAKTVSSRVPQMDSQLDQPWNNPAPVSNRPREVVL